MAHPPTDPLENFVIVDGESWDDPWFECTRCDNRLCDIEDGDTLDVLVGVCLQHAKHCRPRLTNPDDADEYVPSEVPD